MQQASQRGTVQARDISLLVSWTYFAISIVINSMGNVLTLVTSTHIHPHFWGQHTGPRRKTIEVMRF